MTFSTTIPGANDAPSTSQAEIQTNFNQLNAQFDIDHINFVDGSAGAVDRGEHKKVTINDVVADPALGDPKASIYTKTVAGDSELFFEKFHVAAPAGNIVRQLTNLTETTTAAGHTNCTGTVRAITTPWGYIINYGVMRITGALPIVNFAINYTTTNWVATLARGPDSTALDESKLVNIYEAGGAPKLTTGLRLRVTDVPIDINFIAFGV